MAAKGSEPHFLQEDPAWSISAGLPQGALERPCVLVFSGGAHYTRESIQTDFNRMGSQTAVSPHDKENLKYPVFIMLSVFNYACL